MVFIEYKGGGEANSHTAAGVGRFMLSVKHTGHNNTQRCINMASDKDTTQAATLIKAAAKLREAGVLKAQNSTQKGKATEATQTEALKAVKSIGGGYIEAVFIGQDKSRLYWSQKAVIAAFAAAYGVTPSAVDEAVKQLWNSADLPYLWAAAREAATPEQLNKLL